MKSKGIQHQARKRFGQNFLHDNGIIEKIVRAIGATPDDNVIEIGPGMGAITDRLLQDTGGKLDVVELDRDLIGILRTKFFNYPDFTIHEGDALRFDFRQLQQPEKRMRLVGNLPYNISTPLIFHLLSYRDRVQDMHFMLQKEVVERMAAAPGEKAYGKLGVMTQYHCRVMPLFTVPSGAFTPRPKVESAIVRLVPHVTMPIVAKDEKLLRRVVQSAFNMRRKTLRNSLADHIDVDGLVRLGVDPSERAENISLADFVKISDDCFSRMEDETGSSQHS
ncbi:MAG: 16S rRNA (adenine(1518)-N(6)/adenine(1519)-N(6))-dimethyltransferase RsmA [Hahellaceae bacterium]|nr:16S rRNA (adenine(1518)-N(6)/adenine(1519)-N(6))-dimethyltransferase RsmA [Hahellaceae bacterium]